MLNFWIIYGAIGLAYALFEVNRTVNLVEKGDKGQLVKEKDIEEYEGFKRSSESMELEGKVESKVHSVAFYAGIGFASMVFWLLIVLLRIAKKLAA